MGSVGIPTGSVASDRNGDVKNGISRLAGKKTLRVAGLMSGTSADGIDVAVVDISRRGVKLLAFESFPYPPALRRRIFELFDPRTSRVDEICHMDFVLGEVFAQAVIATARKNRLPLKSIDLIGSHGQTIQHMPDPRPLGSTGLRVSRKATRSTLQIGQPCVIAQRTGITTVADFRPRDIAAGGQGAPLVPLADYVLFAAGRKNRAVQNIGGIANVTYLPAGCGLGDVLAFDTGPGNMIIDRAAWHATRGRLTFDRDGKLAAAGTVNRRLLAALMRHRYLRKRPPKSTGREEFGVSFTDKLYRDAKRRGVSDADFVATVTAFTACSIAQAYSRFLPGRVDEAILCGGGARNPVLRQMLRRELGGRVKVMVMDELGVNADAKEAVSFAILAQRTIRGLCGNVPSATGADGPVVLGTISPA